MLSGRVTHNGIACYAQNGMVSGSNPTDALSQALEHNLITRYQAKGDLLLVLEIVFFFFYNKHLLIKRK